MLTAERDSDLALWKGDARMHFLKRFVLQILEHKIPDDTSDAETDARKFNQQIHGGNLQDIGKFNVMLTKLAVHILPCDIFLIHEHKSRGIKQMFRGSPNKEMLQIRGGGGKCILDRLNREK